MTITLPRSLCFRATALYVQVYKARLDRSLFLFQVRFLTTQNVFINSMCLMVFSFWVFWGPFDGSVGNSRQPWSLEYPSIFINDFFSASIRGGIPSVTTKQLVAVVSPKSSLNKRQKSKSCRVCFFHLRLEKSFFSSFFWNVHLNGAIHWIRDGQDETWIQLRSHFFQLEGVPEAAEKSAGSTRRFPAHRLIYL